MPVPSTILIADDEPNNRKTLGTLLSPLGCRVEIAVDGPTTLAQAEALAPDILLLDVMMPGLDGFEVCRRLRTDPLLGEMPIIMVTALEDRASRLRGIEAGADDFISKPFDGVELRTRVQTILRLNRYRRLVVERQRFAWVVETSDDGYLIIGDGAADEIYYANPKARRYLELPDDPEAAAGGSFQALVRQHYHTMPEGAWVQSKTPTYLVRPENVQSRPLWLQVDELELPEGAGAGRLLRLRDVTTQMDLLYGTWSFSTLASHKLRAPLTAIYTSLDVLADLADDMPAAERQELLGIARYGANRLKGEVEAVLNYVTAPNLARQGSPLSLRDLRDVASDLEVELKLEPVHVTCEPGLVDVAVWPSRLAIELVLRELFENARKFHPAKQPNLRVLAGRGEPGFVQLVVQDDGPGLPVEELERIWQPYYQSEKTLSGEVPGIGLGLAAIAMLLGTIGGAGRALNRVDHHGLTIELKLPLAETTAIA